MVRPKDVIVDQGKDRAGSILDAADELDPLVGPRNSQDADFVGLRTGDGLNQLLDTREIPRNGDDDDFFGLVCEPKTDRVGERVLCIDGRNDDGYISSADDGIVLEQRRLVAGMVLFGKNLLIAVVGAV